MRLVSINAPDRGECFAEAGRDHLIASVEGKRAHLEITGEDQFGRTLAHVFVDGRHINLEMVELGMALASTPPDDDPHGEAIIAAEEAAFEEGTGLWSASGCGHVGPLPEVVIDPETSVVDPPGADDQDLDAETIVILNEGTEIVDLTGWIVRDESTRHRFTFADGGVPESTNTLGPGERLVVPSRHQGWDPGDGPVWNNTGDMALLQLPDGTVVSRWRY